MRSIFICRARCTSEPMSSRVFSPGDCWAKLSRLETSSRVRRACWPILRAMLAWSGSRSCLGCQQFGISQNRSQRIIDLVRRSGHQLGERCQLLPLHQFGLQALQIFQAGARLFQQAHQFPVHQILTKKYEQAQHQHGRQRHQQPELPQVERRRIAKPRPISHQREEKAWPAWPAGGPASASGTAPAAQARQAGFNSRASRRGPDHPANGSDERDVIDAAGMVLTASDGGIQRHRT